MYISSIKLIRRGTVSIAFHGILIIIMLLLPLPRAFAVEPGTYHCTPVHSIHYLAREDGDMSEYYVNNKNVMIVITIDQGNILIVDNRANEKKSIDIINNVAQGSVIGKSGTRQFYMDTVLHYFYGSVDNGGAVAYAEDGRCERY